MATDKLLRSTVLLGTLCTVVACQALACQKEKTEPPTPAPVANTPVAEKGALPSPEIDPARRSMFAALPASFESKDNPSTEARVELGRMLYFEKRLSKGQTLSCNSCHDLAKGGADGHPVSDGHKGQKGTRNSPTVFNAAGHVSQFWDGRAKDVEEQAKGPVLNPVEMAMPDDKRVVETLKSIPGYLPAFQKAFPNEKEPITFDNMAKAIGAFERKLVTPSRWDKYLAGDDKALTEAEKVGFNVFTQSGCNACHSGSLAGGTMFQKLGAATPWPNTKDQGRYEVTKQEADRMQFKVPSLRNIASTAPYFHDGSIAALEDAVRAMAKHQLGRTLTDAEVSAIVVWLKALAGDLPKDLGAPPTLPPDGPTTPKPDLT